MTSQSNGVATATEALPSAPLARIAAVADLLDEPRVQDDAQQLSARLEEGRFHVACIGQFKRGKSTLLDALVGRAVLPTDVVPVTAVPTVVRHGPQWCARVRLADGEWHDVSLDRLADFVSEDGNPENHKGVIAAEVFAPSAFLSSGMCLVDTPGLGSVFTGNTQATHAFVPHIDAAIVVLGADPPISGDELDIVETIAAQVQHVIVVLNKADRIGDDDRATAVAFTRAVLERRLARPIGPIFEVSALERLERRGPPRDWPRLLDTLARLASESGAALASTAAGRGQRRLARRLLDAVGQRRLALMRPEEESQRRLAELADAATRANQWLDDLDAVLAGEQRRLLTALDARRGEFLATIQPQARAALAARWQMITARWGPRLRREAMAAAVEIARRSIVPWLAEQQQVAASAFSERATRFRELERQFIERVSAMGVAELGALEITTGADATLAGHEAFYFKPLLEVARPASPIRGAADVLLVAVGARRTVVAASSRFLRWLLELNSSRVQADVGQRLDESRRRLAGEVRALLREVQAGAARAVSRAVELRALGAESVRVEAARLDAFEAALRPLVGELDGDGSRSNS